MGRSKRGDARVVVVTGVRTCALPICPRRSVGGRAVSPLEPGLGLRLAGGVGGEAGGGCTGPHGVGGRHVIIVQWVDVSVAERLLAAQAGEGVQVVDPRRGAGGL